MKNHNQHNKNVEIKVSVYDALNVKVKGSIYIIYLTLQRNLWCTNSNCWNMKSWNTDKYKDNKMPMVIYTVGSLYFVVCTF